MAEPINHDKMWAPYLDGLHTDDQDLYRYLVFREFILLDILTDKFEVGYSDTDKEIYIAVNSYATERYPIT